MNRYKQFLILLLLGVSSINFNLFAMEVEPSIRHLNDNIDELNIRKAEYEEEEIRLRRAGNQPKARAVHKGIKGIRKELREKTKQFQKMTESYSEEMRRDLNKIGKLKQDVKDHKEGYFKIRDEFAKAMENYEKYKDNEKYGPLVLRTFNNKQRQLQEAAAEIERMEGEIDALYESLESRSKGKEKAPEGEEKEKVKGEEKGGEFIEAGGQRKKEVRPTVTIIPKEYRVPSRYGLTETITPSEAEEMKGRALSRVMALKASFMPAEKIFETLKAQFPALDRNYLARLAGVSIPEEIGKAPSGNLVDMLKALKQNLTELKKSFIGR